MIYVCCSCFEAPSGGGFRGQKYRRVEGTTIPKIREAAPIRSAESLYLSGISYEISSAFESFLWRRPLPRRHFRPYKHNPSYWNGAYSSTVVLPTGYPRRRPRVIINHRTPPVLMAIWGLGKPVSRNAIYYKHLLPLHARFCKMHSGEECTILQEFWLKLQCLFGRNHLNFAVGKG